MFDLIPAITEIFLIGVGLAVLMVGAFSRGEPDASRLVIRLNSQEAETVTEIP